MRLALDTSVLIAAFVSRGVCPELVEHCQRSHRIVTSEILLGEFESELVSKFKIQRNQASAAVAVIRGEAEVLERLLEEE